MMIMMMMAMMMVMINDFSRDSSLGNSKFLSIETETLHCRSMGQGRGRHAWCQKGLQAWLNHEMMEVGRG